MNIEEARKKVKITDEERSAVINYLEFGHMQKNSLSSFDVLKYLENSSKGWHLEGIGGNSNESPKSSEEIGSKILTEIEDFSNIYLAMVKYMHENTKPTKLMRGTSVKTARNLRAGGSYDRIMSTTTDETTAKSFGNAYEPAFLRIIPGDDIPFIAVTDFVGEENLNRNEEEYILAPFTKIKSATFRSQYNGYSYYDIELEKPELRQFEEGEKEKFAAIIKSDFAQVIGLGKKLQKLQDEYEIIGRRMQESYDREDRIYMSNRREEIMNEMGEMRPKLTDFSQMMKNYIQGKCAEKEQEYMQAYEICRVDDEKIMQEQRRVYEEERRQKGIADFSKRIQRFNEDSSKCPEEVNRQYRNLQNEWKKYSNFAKKLGIRYDLNINENSINQNLSTLTNNFMEMRRKISDTVLQEDSPIQDVENALTKIIEYSDILKSVQSSIPDLATMVGKYGNDALTTTKKGADGKAQQIIKNTKMHLLERKRKLIEDRKISFFGRIRGLEKLKMAELEGIDIEMQLLRTTPIKEKNSYSIRDILSDLRAFSISELQGQNTEEMQFFEDTIKSFFSVDEGTIQELAIRKVNAHPMVIQSKKRWERTSEKIAKVQNKNNDLKIEISKAQYATHKETNPFGHINSYNQDNIIKDLEGMVEHMAKVSTLPEKPNSEVRTQISTEIDKDEYIK